MLAVFSLHFLDQAGHARDRGGVEDLIDRKVHLEVLIHSHQDAGSFYGVSAHGQEIILDGNGRLLEDCLPDGE